MLIGEYTHIIDNKKRLALPVKFRRELGKAVVVTKGLESCLEVYPEKEWKLESDKIKGLPKTKEEARFYSRIKLAGATSVNMDRLGRILIPDYLKKYADLKKNVVICGLSNRLEIWDENRWEKFKKKVEPNLDSIASSLEELGI